MNTNSQSKPQACAPSVSFEFFPPKSDAGMDALWQAILALKDLNPSFVSVTYGAGGSTRDRTHKLVKRIREETTLEPAAHLTCVGASKDEIREIAESYWKIGVKRIVALRGDAPEGETYAPHPQGYAYADDLVQGLKEVGDFHLSVAAYPETHPQAISIEDDLAHLKRKFDAGADDAITQYFFDNQYYLDFISRAESIGISKPIFAGILPVANYTQMVKFSAMCGTDVPNWLHERFGSISDEKIAWALAVATAADQCKSLVDAGASHLHFYTLNRPRLIIAICQMLGIKGS